MHLWGGEEGLEHSRFVVVVITIQGRGKEKDPNNLRNFINIVLQLQHAERKIHGVPINIGIQ